MLDLLAAIGFARKGTEVARARTSSAALEVPGLPALAEVEALAQAVLPPAGVDPEAFRSAALAVAHRLAGRGADASARGQLAERIAAAALPPGSLVQLYHQLADGLVARLLPVAEPARREALGHVVAVLAEDLPALREAPAGPSKDPSQEHRETLEKCATDAEAVTTEVSSISGLADMVLMNVKMVGAMVAQIHHGIESVAASSEEGRQAAASVIAGMERSDASIRELGELTSQIGSAIKAISGIAGQTNMLALNATIEAARAGAYGRGFGVVANEVKELARQTARAAEQVTGLLGGVRRGAGDAAVAMHELRASVEGIAVLMGKIAAAVAEQNEASNGVQQYVREAETSIVDITAAITRLEQSVGQVAGSVRSLVTAA